MFFTDSSYYTIINLYLIKCVINVMLKSKIRPYYKLRMKLHYVRFLSMIRTGYLETTISL